MIYGRSGKSEEVTRSRSGDSNNNNKKYVLWNEVSDPLLNNICYV